MYARENETVLDTCIWDVVFETNTGEEGDGGELPLLTSAFYNMSNSSYSTLGTSVTEVCRRNYSYKLKKRRQMFRISCYRPLDKNEASRLLETSSTLTVFVSDRLGC